ncbi:MAG: enoyl-CoA hydratase-related protein [Bacteroidota bacterium]
MTPQTPLIKYRIDKRIAYITLNRPEKRNAFSQAFVEELRAAFLKAKEDDSVKVVVLEAEGQVFCAGADLGYLQQLQNFSYEENLADSTYLKDLYELIFRFPKVVIAAVQGHAIAGGCGLVTVCDYVLTVPEAKFGYTEVKIGFVPAIVMPILVRKIGESRARTLLLTGDLINAEKAEYYGVVHEIVERESLKDRVNELAQHLVNTNSGTAMQLTKKLLLEVVEKDLSKALEAGAEMNARARQTEDCQKGIAGFLNKEKATF